MCIRDRADSAPKSPVASVKNCYVAGTISGVSNVGGIFGGEPSCMQCWGNGSGSISNNFFYGTVSGKTNVGAIVGYLKSFDKFQGISNNYYPVSYTHLKSLFKTIQWKSGTKPLCLPVYSILYKVLKSDHTTRCLLYTSRCV